MIGEHSKLIPPEPSYGYDRIRVYTHNREHEVFHRPPTEWEVRQGIIPDEGLLEDQHPDMDIDKIVEETTIAKSQE